MSVTTAQPNQSLLASVAILFGQMTLMGMAAGLLNISANTIFLSVYGAENLTWVYIATGLVVSSIFFGLTALQRRFSSSHLALGSMITLLLTLSAARAILYAPGSTWLSFFMLTIFPFVVQIAFITVGGQAGRIYDIKTLKWAFPLAVTGLSVGFGIAGLLTPTLISIAGQTADLLYGAIVAILANIGLLALMFQRYPAVNAPPSAPTAKRVQSRSLQTSNLFQDRFFVSLLAYQAISAFGTQLIQYIAYNRADLAYPDPDQLAAFFGQFVTLMNIVSVIFGGLIAGRLMARFGARFGLVLNPLMVVLLTLVSLILLPIHGALSSVLLWSALIAHITDIVLSNSTTNTAINTMYQALPANQRGQAQTLVEGVGVPASVSAMGIVLAILNALGDLDFAFILWLVIAIAVVWFAAAVLLFRQYGTRLWRTMQRRALGDADLALQENSTQAALTRMLVSGDIAQVRLALDMQASAGTAAHIEQLAKLLVATQPAFIIEALQRIEALDAPSLLPQVRELAQQHPDEPVRAAAIRAWCGLAEAEAVEAVRPLLEDSSPTLRQAACVGLLRYGGLGGVMAAAHPLETALNSPDPTQQRFAAQVIGEVADTSFYYPLFALLQSTDIDVQLAALEAATRIAHPRLIPALIARLNNAALRPMVMDALAAQGEQLLEPLSTALDGNSTADEAIAKRLIRALASQDSAAVNMLLLKHIQHPRQSLRDELLLALQAHHFRAKPTEQSNIRRALAQSAQDGTRLLQALVTVEADARLAILQRALEGELALLQKRIFLQLSLLYDRHAIQRAEWQLAEGNPMAQGLALETLDVTLSKADKKLVLPLIDRQAPLAKRLSQLGAASYAGDLTALLSDIVNNPDGYWQDAYTQATAIYSIGVLNVSTLQALLIQALQSEQAVIRESAAWALAQIGPER